MRTQGGDAVANATAVGYGVDFANLNGTIEEKRNKAERLKGRLDKAAPEGWGGVVAGADGQGDKSPETLIGQPSGKYATVHTPQDWDIPDPTVVTAPIVGDTGYRLRDPTLGFQHTQGGPYGGLKHAPAGETLLLSVRDASRSPYFQDNADEDLSGVTTNGTVVVEQLGPGGGNNVINSEKYVTRHSIGGSSFLGANSKEHKFAKVTLSAGFYRIYPEDSPESSYLLAVGDPAEIISGYQEDLRNEAGNLIDQAKLLEDLQANGTFKRVKTTTNENGSFEMNFGSDTVKTVDVVAYKVPDSLDVDPQNATRADAREYYESVKIDNTSDLSEVFDVQSMYIQTGREAHDVPKQNVTVEVREVSAESYVDPGKVQNITSKITDYFNKYDFTSLAGLPQSVIEDMSREELEQLYETLSGQIANNPQLEQRVADRLGIEQSEVVTDPEDLSTKQLLERIRAIDVVLKQGPQISEPPTTNPGEITNETIGAIFEFAQLIPSDKITVLAKYSNGTTVPVNESYISVEETGIFGATGTRIAVEDYPVPNNQTGAVEFVTRVTSESGESGSGSQIIRNPNFTGSIPGLEHISFSTLSPGPDESVTLKVAPDRPNRFGELEAVEVTGPNGEINATVENGEASFRTDGTGRYSVGVTYSNADGNNVTEPVDIRALGGNIDNPATVRAQKGLSGPYALTGDDLVGGNVETHLGNGRVNVLARVGGNDDPPPAIHSHVETIDMPSRATTCTQIVREPDDTNVRQRATVITHLQNVGDDSYVYRVADGNLQPIPADGGKYGSVSHTDNATSINTYTQADGGVCVRYISNPNTADWVNWQIQNFEESIPDLPGIDILQTAPMMPTTTSAATGAIA
ncbi:hypothetical protein [Haloarcula amylovorans]|uniref:hypothetical protein n=1 Tax=Haloarcula amylovorans TaxID=2562280 RepID=UPI001FD84BD1|nr:hypothetical protein [Halomicroarcula amylolytica]